MNSIILPVIGLIVPLVFFYKAGFGIKQPTEDDMPLSQEIKSNNASQGRRTATSIYYPESVKIRV